MNNDRRKRIDAMISRLEEIRDEIDAIREEEQDAFDNMPESLQNSERGDMAQEAISNLENVDVDEIISYLESAKE